MPSCYNSWKIHKKMPFATSHRNRTTRNLNKYPIKETASPAITKATSIEIQLSENHW